MSLDGPVLITTTREIRKRSPLRCSHGDQGAHLVGLQLTKILFNFYSTERDIIVSEEVIEQLITDINDKSNFACETPEENTEDKYVEEEVLGLLFNGTIRYSEMVRPAKVMFARLRQLLQTMIDHLGSSRSEELRLIHGEIEEGVFPLRKS